LPLLGEGVDAVVTDPPYGLSKEPDMAEVLRHWLAGDDYQHQGAGFMGKTWDSFVPGPSIWRECLRVLKPGGHQLAFFGTRTQDMGTLAIRLAGFEIRDSIAWVYGTGFPKSMDVSKAIDKSRDDSADGSRVGAWLRAQREAKGLTQKEVAALWPSASGGLTGCVSNWETIGKVPKWDQWLMLKSFIGFGDEMDGEVWRLNGRKGTPGNEREVIAERPASGIGHNGSAYGGHAEGATQKFDAGPVTVAARQWEGWGTALKPALEPITMARKPLVGTVAANVLAHGCGALNIDGCRVGTDTVSTHSRGSNAAFPKRPGETTVEESGRTVDQRAKLDHSERTGRWPANLIHDGSEEVTSLFPANAGAVAPVRGTEESPASRGNVTGKRDRVPGAFHGDSGSASRFYYCAKATKKDREEGNNHPTVKPTDLMAYLCRLVIATFASYPGAHSPAELALLEQVWKAVERATSATR
jgi:hypothetical protein